MRRVVIAAIVLCLAVSAKAQDYYGSLGFNISALDKTFECFTGAGRTCKAENQGMTTKVSAKQDGDVFRIDFMFDRECKTCFDRLAAWLEKSTNLSTGDVVAVLKIVLATAERAPLPMPPPGIVVETGPVNEFWFLKITSFTLDAWEARKRLKML